MHKVAIIEKIHQDGINLLKNNPAFEFEIIEDASEENLIKVLPNFDACTLRISKLNEKILSNCKNLKGYWHQLPVCYLMTIKPIKAGDELTAQYTLYNDFSDKWD